MGNFTYFYNSQIETKNQNINKKSAKHNILQNYLDQQISEDFILKGVMSGTVPVMDSDMYEIVDLSKQKSKKSSTSKDDHSVPSAVSLYDEHKVLTGNLSYRSNENMAKKKSSANTSDLYAKVDLSKKKSKKTGGSKGLSGRRMKNTSNSSKPSSPNVCDVYAVVDLSKKKARRQAGKKNSFTGTSNSADLNCRSSHFVGEIRNEHCNDIYSLHEEENDIIKSSNKSWKFILLFILFLIFILGIITVVTIVVLSLMKVSSLEMANEEYSKTIFRLTQYNTNLQSNYDTLLNKFYNSNEAIVSVHDELPSIQSQIEKVNTSYHNLYVSHNNISYMTTDYRYTTITCPFVDNYLSSCADIARLNSSYASGKYIVLSSTGILSSLYCSFDG